MSISTETYQDDLLSCENLSIMHVQFPFHCFLGSIVCQLVLTLFNIQVRLRNKFLICLLISLHFFKGIFCLFSDCICEAIVQNTTFICFAIKTSQCEVAMPKKLAKFVALSWGKGRHTAMRTSTHYPFWHKKWQIVVFSDVIMCSSCV